LIEDKVHFSSQNSNQETS